MAKPKARENYGAGSITPKTDANGNQKRNKQGQLAWRVCLSFGYETVIDEKVAREKFGLVYPEETPIRPEE